MKKTVILLATTVALFSACTAGRSLTASQSPSYGWTSPSDKIESADKRMLLYTASIQTEVKNCDTAAAKVSALAKKFNGYFLQSSNFSSTIKVPSSLLKEALTEVEKIGKLQSKDISGNDVTDEFNDYSMRLDNAELARKRYLELLQKAVSVEEILKVEKELERLNIEIELLRGKIIKINHNADYSSITVYYNQKRKLGILGYVFVGTYKCVKWLFVRN